MELKAERIVFNSDGTCDMLDGARKIYATVPTSSLEYVNGHRIVNGEPVYKERIHPAQTS